MSEIVATSELGSRSDEEVSEQSPTPLVKLAYDGLMRLVEFGGISEEDVPEHLRTMFPNH